MVEMFIVLLSEEASMGFTLSPAVQQHTTTSYSTRWSLGHTDQPPTTNLYFSKYCISSMQLLGAAALNRQILFIFLNQKNQAYQHWNCPVGESLDANRLKSDNATMTTN